MNRVRRAIIMAAGYGNRMLPITRNIPKPLIKVNGTAMIETIIRALLANNIEEIYIVVGYLKEQFKSLAEKYPMISLIENPYFDSCNNISSLYAAREYLEEAMILDGDQVIYNEKILSPYFSIPDITVFGQKMIQKNGCLRQRQTGSYRAAEPAEDRGGNCIAFPDGPKTME